MLVVYVLNFSNDPYINIIFLRTMVNRLFFSPRNPKYILAQPQMQKTDPNRFKGNKEIKLLNIHVIQLCIRIIPVISTQNMQLYAGKRQRIGPHLYPFSTTDLTITKTFSTFSDYRFDYRLLCILKKQWFYENRW